MKLVKAFSSQLVFSSLTHGLAGLRDIYIAYLFGLTPHLELFMTAFMFTNFTASVLVSAATGALMPELAKEMKDRGRIILPLRSFKKLLYGLVILFSFIALYTFFYLQAPVSQLLILNTFGIAYVLANITRTYFLFLKQSTSAYSTQSMSFLISILILSVIGHFGLISYALALLIPSIVEVLVLAYLLINKPELNIETQNEFTFVKNNHFYFLIFSGFTMATTNFIDQLMAHQYLGFGVAIISYSTKATQLLMAVFGTIIRFKFFPEISEQYALRLRNNSVESLKRYISVTLLFSIPVTALLYFLSESTVRLLFEHGSFLPKDTLAVSELQRIYILQVPFYLSGLIGIQALNALERGKIIFGIACCNTILNVIFNYFFMNRYGLIGISISTVAVQIFSMSAIMFFLNRDLRSFN